MSSYFFNVCERGAWLKVTDYAQGAPSGGIFEFGLPDAIFTQEPGGPPFFDPERQAFLKKMSPRIAIHEYPGSVLWE